MMRGGHWRDILDWEEGGRVRSFLAMLKNSAVSLEPDLSVMEPPARL